MNYKVFVFGIILLIIFILSASVNAFSLEVTPNKINLEMTKGSSIDYWVKIKTINVFELSELEFKAINSKSIKLNTPNKLYTNTDLEEKFKIKVNVIENAFTGKETAFLKIIISNKENAIEKIIPFTVLITENNEVSYNSTAGITIPPELKILKFPEKVFAIKKLSNASTSIKVINQGSYTNYRLLVKEPNKLNSLKISMENNGIFSLELNQSKEIPINFYADENTVTGLNEIQLVLLERPSGKILQEFNILINVVKNIDYSVKSLQKEIDLNKNNSGKFSIKNHGEKTKININSNDLALNKTIELSNNQEKTIDFNVNKNYSKNNIKINFTADNIKRTLIIPIKNHENKNLINNFIGTAFIILSNNALLGIIILIILITLLFYKKKKQKKIINNTNTKSINQEQKNQA